MPDVTTFADEKRRDQVIGSQTGLSDHASESFGGSEAPRAILGKRHRYFRGKLVRNTTRSRTEIMPTNLLFLDTPKWRT